MTLSAALHRYAQEVTPAKKGCTNELMLILCWQNKPYSSLSLSQPRGSDLAAYRGLRLKAGINGKTIRIEFALISHLYEVARKDRGLEALVNPVKAIRKLKLAKGEG